MSKRTMKARWGVALALALTLGIGGLGCGAGPSLGEAQSQLCGESCGHADATYDNVPVFYNGTDGGYGNGLCGSYFYTKDGINYDPSGELTGLAFQCVEFAQRFMRFKWGVTPANWGGNAIDLCNTHPPGSTSLVSRPIAGDLVVLPEGAGGSGWGITSNGHVAVVTSAPDGNGNFNTISQNWGVGYCASAPQKIWNLADIHTAYGNGCFIHANANGGGSQAGSDPSRSFELSRKVSQPGQIDLFYPANDGHGTLQMAYLDSAGWHDMTLCGGRWTTGPVSAVEDSGGVVRVYYHDAGDNRVHECWRNPSNGQWTDWSFGVSIESGTSAINNGITHVFYHAPGSTPELWESYLDSAGWHHHSLGRWVKGTPNALSNMHVFYHDAGDNLLHDYYWTASAGWQDHRSGLGISNSPVAVEAMVATPTNPSGTMRVYYAGTDAHTTMHEWSWNPQTGQWSDMNTSWWMTAGSVPGVTQDHSGTVRVYYSDGGTVPGHLFEYYLDGSGWHRGSPGSCNLVCGERWMSGSAFATTQPSGNVSVTYRDTGSGDLNELYLDGTGWHLNNWSWSMAR